MTLIIPTHNSRRFINASLKTVIGQTLQSWEALVIDDASTDDSRDIVATMAAADPRIRLVALAANGGPAAARNVGLELAQGRWIAVMDSDDLIHPERLDRLVRAAETQGSDIAADNMLVFDEDPAVRAYALLRGVLPRQIDLTRYVVDGADGRASRKMGYLKPLFRTEFIRRAGVRYTPALRIGEDFSFVRALLAAGARFDVFPDLTYFYRKHAASISHRLSTIAIEAMLADDAAFLAGQVTLAAEMAQATARRHRGFHTAIAFDALVSAIKAQRWVKAFTLAARNNAAARMLRQPVDAAVRRQFRKPRRATFAAGRRHICILTQTRQPSLAVQTLGRMLSAHGDVHLVGGRWRQTGAMTIRTAVRMARLARPWADIVVADGPDAMDAVPYVLRPGSLTLVLVDRLPAASGLAKLARADAILTTRPQDATALRVGCPETPVVLLPGDAAGLPAALAALLTPGRRGPGSGVEAVRQ